MSFFANNNFDPDVIDDDGPSGDMVLPLGTYKVMVNAVEEKGTKDGNGLLLKLEFIIMEGKYVDWRIWGQINLKNASIKAVEIGQKELKRLCDACGIQRLTDSQQLLGKTLAIKTKNEVHDGKTNARPKRYMSVADMQRAGAAAPSLGYSQQALPAPFDPAGDPPF